MGKTSSWVLITILAIVAYLPALQNGFIWDDDDYVVDNAALKTTDGLRRIWIEPGATPQYYPMVFSSFWIERHAWGLRPFGYHVTNILLHAANAILLGFILQRLSVPGAWLAAAIFALHPVHVESVAWITERKNVLSGFFYLFSALTYLRFAESRNRKLYGLSLLLFVCALLSKSVTCTLPVALLLLLWWKKPKLNWKRDVLPLAPFLVAGFAMGLMTIWMERTSVGAQGGDWALPFIDRILVAGRAAWFYALKLLWPETLAFNYPRWNVEDAPIWAWVYPLTALTFLTALFYYRKRIGRGPLVAVLFFILSLFPALGFISYYPMIYSYVADHFQYLASIGLIALVAAGWMSVGKIKPEVRNATAAVLLLVLASLTWRQTHIYRDLKTLWTDTLEKNRRSWLAHNNLGTILVGEGKFQKAGYHFQEALRLNPRFDDAHYNLGVVLTEAGKSDEAIAHYREAIRLNPRSVQAHNNLGLALAHRGDLEAGIAQFNKALALKPDYAKGHNNLGLVLARKNELDAAALHYTEAIRIDPDFLDPYNNLGVLQARQGRLAEAQANFERALRVRPNSAQAHANLARTLSQRGDEAGAKAHYQEALRIQPDLEEARSAVSTGQP